MTNPISARGGFYSFVPVQFPHCPLLLLGAGLWVWAKFRVWGSPYLRQDTKYTFNIWLYVSVNLWKAGILEWVDSQSQSVWCKLNCSFSPSSCSTISQYIWFSILFWLIAQMAVHWPVSGLSLSFWNISVHPYSLQRIFVECPIWISF